jgi:hypothetical protein
MELIAALVLAGSLLAAVFLLLGRLVARLRSRAHGTKANSGAAGGRSCPLCLSVLGPGERVASKLFPGKGDRIMHIMGCVHCWPTDPSVREGPALRRICPVCGGALGAEDWVTARYFESIGRRHVHVLGCPRCRRG